MSSNFTNRGFLKCQFSVKFFCLFVFNVNNIAVYMVITMTHMTRTVNTSFNRLFC